MLGLYNCSIINNNSSLLKTYNATVHVVLNILTVWSYTKESSGITGVVPVNMHVIQDI